MLPRSTNNDPRSMTVRPCLAALSGPSRVQVGSRRLGESLALSLGKGRKTGSILEKDWSQAFVKQAIQFMYIFVVVQIISFGT